MTHAQRPGPAAQATDISVPSPPCRTLGQGRGLTLTIVRPHHAVSAHMAPPALGQCAGATRLTVTHVAHHHTGHPVMITPVPARVANLRTCPDARPYWLVRRSPGTLTWVLIPALGPQPVTQQQIVRHLRRWTASGAFAHTSLSGLRELMGDGYFYGAIAIHDLPHWNYT